MAQGIELEVLPPKQLNVNPLGGAIALYALLVVDQRIEQSPGDRQPFASQAEILVESPTPQWYGALYWVGSSAENSFQVSDGSGFTTTNAVASGAVTCVVLVRQPAGGGGSEAGAASAGWELVAEFAAKLRKLRAGRSGKRQLVDFKQTVIIGLDKTAVGELLLQGLPPSALIQPDGLRDDCNVVAFDQRRNRAPCRRLDNGKSLAH